MGTNFPTGQDSLPLPSGNQRLGDITVLHSTQHDTTDSALYAIEGTILGPWVWNVRDGQFGAGTGSGGDDTAAFTNWINKLLAVGGRGVIPDGDYNISSLPTINRPISISGQSKDGVRLNHTGSGNFMVLDREHVGGLTNQVAGQIENFTLRAGSGTRALFQWAGTFNGFVSNLYADGNGNASGKSIGYEIRNGVAANAGCYYSLFSNLFAFETGTGFLYRTTNGSFPINSNTLIECRAQHCKLQGTGAAMVRSGSGFQYPYWKANTVVGTGTAAIPANMNGWAFVNLGASGTTGATEPDWPTTIGATVVDNTVTWTLVAWDDLTNLPSSGCGFVVVGGNMRIFGGDAEYSDGLGLYATTSHKEQALYYEGNGAGGFRTNLGGTLGVQGSTTVVEPDGLSGSDLAWGYELSQPGSSFVTPNDNSYQRTLIGGVKTDVQDAQSLNAGQLSSPFIGAGRSQNFLRQSETIDSATWVKQGLSGGGAPTVTPNAVLAPDAVSMTADQIDFVAPVSNVSQTVNLGAINPDNFTWVFAIWMRATTPGYLNMDVVTFNNAAYPVTLKQFYIVTQWRRYWITVSPTGSIQNAGNYQITCRFERYTREALKRVFVWGAQLEQSAFPGPYVPTVGTARTTSGPQDTETALWLLRNVGGTYSMQQVTMGAADSGGLGFKSLVVPN